MKNERDAVLCDGVKAHCFKSEMESEFNKAICECDPNCHEMRFEVVSASYPISPEECMTSDGKFIASCRQKANSSILVNNDINEMIAERLR